jgi:hypothetical protein
MVSVSSYLSLLLASYATRKAYVSEEESSQLKQSHHSNLVQESDDIGTVVFEICRNDVIWSWSPLTRIVR